MIGGKGLPKSVISFKWFPHLLKGRHHQKYQRIRLKMTRESLNGPRARANAVWSLQQMEHQRTLDWLVGIKAGWLDTPFGSQLIYGTVRHYYSLGIIIDQLIDKPLKSKDRDLFHPLLVGAVTYEAPGLCINK